MLVAVPLMLRKRYILKRFNELLSKRHTRGRGERTFRESRALYPVATQFNIHALQKTLAAYDMRKSEPSLTLWEIAQKLSLGTKLSKEELTSKGTTGATHKKSVLSVAASKKIALAEKIIEGVGKGVFPAISTRTAKDH